ncbi:MAG: hypothetical protein KDC71_06765 [Acidobacteria bacterium]|nr:hypothetical protein [Acidobacteriota bacterium]
MSSFNYRDALGYTRKRTLRFHEFVDAFIENPVPYLHTSSTLIAEAIKHFGFSILVRSGEPVISYEVFKDIFSNGTNAVFGQEFCIKQVVDAIESAGKETGPNRGLILVGPPASGKTNIIDLITLALEEYTKLNQGTLFSFFFQFKDPETDRTVEVWSSFRHNPIFLFPTILQRKDKVCKPRIELFEFINGQRLERGQKKLVFPTYFQNGSLDKCSFDILESLLQNPRNRGKSLYDIIEEYVRVEEIVFSNAQANGISNVDDMRALRVRLMPFDLGPDDRAIINHHLPGNTLYQYEGAIVAANRGILHIHDAFGLNESGRSAEADYKPLLMLLGSGKVSIDSTQASVDNTVFLTTNLEEMALLDRQLTSSKLLDRIEKIPVNYLLDANAEMDILHRDLGAMREKYEVDPNLLRIAAYYAVLTRLLPPGKPKNQTHWNADKKQLFQNITPEQKLFLYAFQPEDAEATIRKLPHWHPFRNEAMKLGFDIDQPETFRHLVVRHPKALALSETGLFSNEQLRLIDDEFMRELRTEHIPHEGKHGISVRQLQNIMRNTISHSDGRKIHVGTFLSQLRRMILEGPELHHWMAIDPKYKTDRKPIPSRKLGETTFGLGEGDYGDFAGLVWVLQAIYYHMLKREITICVVDRDPGEIEMDLRRYIQFALLANALENKAFAHIMVPRFTFVDPRSGEKIDSPDLHFMASIERVLGPGNQGNAVRQKVAQKFLDLQNTDQIQLEKGKTVINSSNDQVMENFAEEYGLLLGHRRTVEGINPEQLRDAFFQKRNNPQFYESYPEPVRELVENVLHNLVSRFGYPVSIALDTLVFALRKNIVDFGEIIG